MATSAVDIAGAVSALKQEGLEVLGSASAGHAEILTPEALRFVAGPSREFEPPWLIGIRKQPDGVFRSLLR